MMKIKVSISESKKKDSEEKRRLSKKESNETIKIGRKIKSQISKIGKMDIKNELFMYLNQLY